MEARLRQVGMVLSVCLGAGAAFAAAADVGPAARAIQEKQQALTRLRRRAVAGLQEQRTAERRTEPFRSLFLKLDEAVDGRTISVKLRRRAGKWLPGFGETEWRRGGFVHEVDAGGLSISDSALEGVLKIHLQDGTRHSLDVRAQIRDGDVRGLHKEAGTEREPLSINTIRGVAGVHGGDDWQAVTLRLFEALGGRELTLECFARNGKVFLDKCTARRWNTMAHVPDASGLTITGKAIRGDLKVRLLADKWVPGDGKAIDAIFRIDAAVEYGAIRGTFDFAGAKPHLGAVKGVVGGTARGLATESLSLPDAPTVSPDGKSPEELYAAAVAAEKQAVDEYHRIRAYVIATGTGLRFEAALDLSPARYPLRPEFDKGADAPLRSIQEHVDRLHAVAERWASAGNKNAHGFLTGRVTPDDPDFGPWYGDEPLAANEQGRPAMPEVSAKGRQQWRYVSGWQLFGPFPADPEPLLNTPPMPPLIHVPAAEYGKDGTPATDHMPQTKERMAWLPVRPERARTWPPVGSPDWWKEPFTKGWGPEFLFYAYAEVESPSRQEVWIAAQCFEHRDCFRAHHPQGKLWINDRLAWSSFRRIPPPDGPQATMKIFWRNGTGEYPLAARELQAPRAIFRTTLQQGVNRLLLEVHALPGRTDMPLPLGKGTLSASFSVHLCAAGAPRDASAAAALDEQKDRVWQRHPFDTGQVRGYRGNGHGTNPSAAPAAAWDPKTGVNVIWRTPMPDFSNGSPVLAADRVFTCADMHTLLCCRKSDGKILWTRECDPFEFIDKELGKKVAELKEQAKRAEALLGPLRQERQSLERAIEGEDTGEKAKQDLGKKIAALDERIDSLVPARRQHESLIRKYGLPKYLDCWGLCTGSSFSTPVTDGTHVWVRFGTGVIACFDLEGNRKWAFWTHLPGIYAHSPSPLLVNGKLIVKQNETALPAKQRKWPPRTSRLMAYHAATGDLLWETEVRDHGGRDQEGTPMPVRLTNGTELLDVVVTPAGQVIRADDGKRVIDELYLAAFGGNCSVAAEKDIVVFPLNYGYMAAVRLILIDRDTVGFAPYWEPTWVGGGMHAFWTAYWPVIHNGRVYNNGIVREHDLVYPVPWHMANVVDLHSGQRLQHVKPLMRDPGYGYCPPMAAGPYVFFSGSGGMTHRPGPPHQGEMAVMDTTLGAGEVVFRTTVDRMEGAPVFEGDRMYLRTHKWLQCIGIKGEEGNRYNNLMQARTLLEQFGSRPPLEPVLDVPLPKDLDAADGAPVVRLVPKQTPDRWLFCGPFPTDENRDILAPLGGCARARPGAGTKVTAGSVAHSFVPLDEKFIVESRGMHLVDLGGPAGKKPQTDSFFYTVLHHAAPGTYRFRISSWGAATVWLGGVEIAPHGLVRIPRGRFPMMVRSRLKTIPPFGRFGMSPAFLETRDPREQRRQWVESIVRRRHVLERILRLAPPDSTEARRAKTLLNAIKEKAV